MEDIQDLQKEESTSGTVFVMHTNNTTSDAPGGGSWIDYWKDETKQEIPLTCPCCGEETTDDNPMVGAHVVKWVDRANSPQQKYIVPTCRNCNSKYQGVHIDDTVFSVQENYLCEVPL